MILTKQDLAWLHCSHPFFSQVLKNPKSPERGILGVMLMERRPLWFHFFLSSWKSLRLSRMIDLFSLIIQEMQNTNLDPGRLDQGVEVPG